MLSLFFYMSLFLKYGECSKISNTFLFSNKMLVTRAGIHKMHVRIANGEDPDQQSDLSQHDLSRHCGTLPFWQATFLKF